MTMTIVLEGSITPVEGSPLATAPIRPKYEVNTNEKYTHGDSDTARLPRIAVTHDGSRIYTAVFPASGIRGKLRRMARNAVYAVLQDARGDSAGWDVSAHRDLTVGGVKGSGSESHLVISKIKALREEIPLQSVFGQSEGFGVSWMAGRLMVGMAVPGAPLIPDIVTGVRSDDLRNPDEARFLTDEAAAQLSDIATAERRSTQLRRQVKDLQKQLATAKKAKDKEDEVARLEDEVSLLTQELESLSDLVGQDVSVQMPLSGYETIPPGTELAHRMVLRNANAAEFGTLLSALERLALDPQLGAHAAAGCGIVECRWTVKVDGKVLGTLTVHPFDRLEVDGAELAKLADEGREAFKEAILTSRLAKAA